MAKESLKKITMIDICVGKNLQKLRSCQNLSQGQVAKMLGVTFQQVQKYENGINRLPSSKLYQLHQFFDVPLDYFFQGYGEQKKETLQGLEVEAQVMLLLKKIKNQNLKKKIAKIIYILAS